MKLKSQLALDVEVFVVGVLPHGRWRKVRIVEVLATALSPTDRLHLAMTPEECWIECEVIHEGVEKSTVKS